MKESSRRIRQEKWITWYDKTFERRLFFYATLVMFVAWGLSKLWGG